MQTQHRHCIDCSMNQANRRSLMESSMQHRMHFFQRLQSLSARLRGDKEAKRIPKNQCQFLTLITKFGGATTSLLCTSSIQRYMIFLASSSDRFGFQCLSIRLSMKYPPGKKKRTGHLKWRDRLGFQSLAIRLSMKYVPGKKKHAKSRNKRQI